MSTWRMNVLFSELVLLFLSPLFLAQQLEKIEPGQALYGQVLQNNETVLYHLINLQPQTGYELRISYPATIPTDVVIELLDDASLYKIGRKLLNVEKLVINSDVNDLEKFVSVRAVRVGLPLHADQLQDPLIYNIVLDTLYFGLPLEVWKMGVLLLVVSTVVIALGVPLMLDFLDEHCKKTVHQS